MGKEAVFQGGCFRGEDERVGKYGLFQDFFAGRAVKARPGIAPGFGAVSAVVDGVHWTDEKSITCFQMVGGRCTGRCLCRGRSRGGGSVGAWPDRRSGSGHSLPDRRSRRKERAGGWVLFSFDWASCFLSQKCNILLRRKQFLKKTIQKHRIDKSYKSKSEEKPAAYVKWLQLYIKISHI